MSPEEAYSAARFCEDARRLMGEITARGKVPLLVGGTMLYYKALREALRAAEADPQLRKGHRRRRRPRRLAGTAPVAALDPDAAAISNPTTPSASSARWRSSASPAARWPTGYTRRDDAEETHRFIPIALAPGDRAVLHARIRRRFDSMLLAGFVDEVIRLRRHTSSTPTCRRCAAWATGRRWNFWTASATCAPSATRGVFATRQLMKRQITWQRNGFHAKTGAI